MAITIEERLAAIGPKTDRMEAVRTIGLFLAELEAGSVRAAIRDEDGVWRSQTWVKEGILLAFRVGVPAEFASGTLSFIEISRCPKTPLRTTDAGIGEIRHLVATETFPARPWGLLAA